MNRRIRPSKPRFGSAYAPVVDPLHMTEVFPVRSIHHEQPDTLFTHLHIHDVLEIGYCHRGDGVFVIEDKVRPFSSGCASIVTEREFHLARSSPGKTSYWSFHHVDTVALLATTEDLDVLRVSQISGESFPNIFFPDQNPEITQLVKELDDEAWGSAPGRKSAIVGLLQTLLARIQRLAPTANVDATGERHDAIRKVGPALAVIAGHYSEHLDVADLAESCGLSVTHFRRLFKAALRQSPVDYLARFRVQKASTLLAGDRASVLEAALACGFNSLSAFSRQFSATFGLSPRAWRARQRI